MQIELIEADRVQSIIGAFYEVYRYFHGHGLNENIYANAMAWELGIRGHHVDREFRIAVTYKGHRVGKQRLDLVVDRTIIVETKATELLSLAASRQLLCYLRASPFSVGLLLHFGPRPNFKKFVDFPKPKIDSIRIHPSNPGPKADKET